MRIYNSITRHVEQIVPLEPGVIRMYTCGPTVYRFIHVGNLRTFTMADWLRRALEYAGLRVEHVKNITDVGHMRQEVLDRGEDKLIAQARREGKTSAEIAAFYTAAFHEDERRLNILPAHVFPHATAHVPEMIAIVRDLLAKGVAYEVHGTVFFDVTRFPAYGALSGNQIARHLARTQDEVSAMKRHPEDFPLWKVAEPGREMAWESPWGRGFPGWHIECSAMSIKYLGPQFDLHTGGVDNMFPHHEDEIAQSEAHTGRRFVTYWVHAQHLLSDGLKMAKSTGNAYTLADVTARGFDPLALRYFYTTAHYRSRINFTFSALHAAEIGLTRLRLALLALARDTPRAPSAPPAARGRQAPPTTEARESSAPVTPDRDVARARRRQAFLDAVEHDLNIPRAMAVVWSLLRGEGAALPAAERLALILDFDRVLGLDLAAWLARHRDGTPPGGVAATLPRAVAETVRAREDARRAHDFARADALRAEVADQGFAIRDTRAGPLVVARRPDEGLTVISRSADVPIQLHEPDRYDFSISLLAHNNRADLERCIAGLLRHRYGRALELVIVDNASTDDTLHYLRHLAREGVVDARGTAIAARVFFADHDMGFAAGRNATMRAGLGRIVVLLDTSIEPAGDIWTPLERALADPTVGLVGPYALVTEDLKEFQETEGPPADAVEGYLMAFRRALLPEVGPAEEKFRFYRLMDVYMSFLFKTSGYGVLRVPEVGERIVKHPHREWYSLSEEERASRSKHNFDIFRRRWHHGESLLVANYVPEHRHVGHDHDHHVGGTHAHAPHELPPPGQAHTHLHQHWPDHAHEHAHVHERPPAPTGATGAGDAPQRQAGPRPIT